MIDQQGHESVVVSNSPAEAVEVRAQLLNLLRTYPSTDAEIERSMGLFLRGSLLARFMAVEHVYRLVIDKPGCIFDLGTWRGQTAVLCENYRAVLEPLNPYRRIVCFDTFNGYAGFSDADAATELHRDGTYGVGGSDYAALLRGILEMHEASNVNGHNRGKHSVIEGDIRETLPAFLTDNPSEFPALVFFDLNSVEPSQDALERMWDVLVPGGVIAFWQLTQKRIPAEGNVYRNSFMSRHAHSISKCPTYPGLVYLVKP
jgi:hypothetical protein